MKSKTTLELLGLEFVSPYLYVHKVSILLCILMSAVAPNSLPSVPKVATLRPWFAQSFPPPPPSPPSSSTRLTSAWPPFLPSFLWLQLARRRQAEPSTSGVHSTEQAHTQCTRTLTRSSRPVREEPTFGFHTKSGKTLGSGRGWPPSQSVKEGVHEVSPVE